MIDQIKNTKTVCNSQIKISSSTQQKPVTGDGGGLLYSVANEADPVVRAWGEYLDQRDWQLWTTLTTGRELTLPGARRAINKLSDHLKRSGYPSEIFWCAEPFDLKEGYHLHSLIRFAHLDAGQENRSEYNCLVKGWRQITGDQSARIYSERYRKDKGANHYVGKYITKTRSDYDIIAPQCSSEDQQFNQDLYNISMQEKIKEEQERFRKESWRKAVGMDLQRKGIYAGKPAPDQPKYENTKLTFDQYENQIYKEEAISSTFVKIGDRKFTLSPIG